MSRHDELQALLDRLVASARARRVREAWGEAAARLGLELRVAPRLFEDVVEGGIGGLPVRISHLFLPELPALSTVVSIDALGGLPQELVLEAEDVLGAYDWARAARPPFSTPSAYRSKSADAGQLPVEVRALLVGTGVGIGAGLRQGGVSYHHKGPLDDAGVLVSVVLGLAEVLQALVGNPDAIPDQLLTQAQTGEGAVRQRAARDLARYYPGSPQRASLPPGARAPGTE